MDNIRKYFELSGTISGLNYFLRNCIVSVLSYLIGYGIGVSVATDNITSIIIYVALFSPVFWFSIATIYKRFNALVKRDAMLYTVLLISAQIGIGALPEVSPIRSVLVLVTFITGLFLIFKNSDIENHEG